MAVISTTRVSEQSKVNCMDSKNLAICWWPTLLQVINIIIPMLLQVIIIVTTSTVLVAVVIVITLLKMATVIIILSTF